MEAFENPKPENEDEVQVEETWPPGMPETAGTEAETAEAEAETAEAGAEAEADAPVPEPEPEPVSEEPSEGEVFEPHAVHLESETKSEPVPEPAPEPVAEDEAETLVNAPPPAGPRRKRTPRVRRPSLGGATVSLGSGRPRALALVALLGVAAAIGLLVTRSSSSTDESAPAPPTAASKPDKTPAPADTNQPAATKPTAKAPAAGFTRVTVTAGGYTVDVPTALARTVNGPLVTFSSSNRSRAYAVNGTRSDNDSLSAVAKRVLAGYRDDYRLTEVKVTRSSGGDMRVTAHGARRGGSARQDIVAVVFRGENGKGTYVLQRFTPRGKSAPATELDAVRDSVQPIA